MNDNDELYNNDDSLLRSIREYTSRIDLSHSDHTIEIARPAGDELAENLTRLRELICRILGTGLSEVSPETEHTSDG